MIIEIESYYGNTLISGKARNISQLKNRIMKIINDFGTDNFRLLFYSIWLDYLSL